MIAALSGASLGAICIGAAAGEESALEGPTLCPFRLATGVPCPFCRITRSLLALGQGRLETSLQLSPVGIVVPLVAALAGGRAVAALARGSPGRWPLPAVAGLTILILAGWALQLSGGVA